MFLLAKRYIGLAVVLLLQATGATAQNRPRLDQNSAADLSAPAQMPPPAAVWGMPSYVRNYIPRLPMQDATQINETSQPQQVQASTVYKDGFNRSIQAVQHYAGGSGTNVHLVQPLDNRNLPESRSYLPYAAAGWGYDYQMFTQQHNYNNNKWPNETYTSYSITRNMSDAGQRAVKTMAPGKSQVGQGRGVTVKQVTNTASEVRLFILDANGLPTGSSYYAAGMLLGQLATDAEGGQTLNYTTKEGRLVYSSTWLNNLVSGQSVTPVWGTTYYVYDDLGRLRYTLPPKATALISGGTLTQTQLNDLCFRYLYDEKGRKIEQQVPGKAAEYFVYDKKDRVVLYQDGEMRHKATYRGTGTWLFNFYDALDRLTVTGICIQPEDRLQLDNLVHDNSVWPASHWLYYVKNYDLIQAYPVSLFDCQMLSYTYYDDYSLIDPAHTNRDACLGELAFSPLSLPEAEYPLHDKQTRGLVTGTKVKIMPAPGAGVGQAGEWRQSWNWYDKKGRPVYSLSYDKNAADQIIHAHYNGTQYDFNSRVLQSKHVIYNGKADDGVPLHTEQSRNIYDAITGQLKETRRKVDTGNWVVQHLYGYDELGRMTRQVLGNYGEVQDMSYNIRGQLTGINAVYAETGNRQGESRSFGQSLKYDYGFDDIRYDGKIAGMVWRGASATTANAYGYSYDKGGRLTHAEYSRKGTLPGWDKTTTDYTVSNLTYDLGGNLKSMDQKAVKPGTGIVDMDKLVYNYQNAEQSNRLDRMTDNGGFQDLGDFDNGTTGNNADYGYDHNGNVSTDHNKHIDVVRYTHFNKPSTVSFSNGNQIIYSYDAAGTKVQEVQKVTGQPDKVLDYVGNFVYENNRLQYAQTAEGRTTFAGAAAREEYFVKDHLGNVRSVIDVQTLMIQQYLATYEIASANLEGLFFGHMDEIREDKPGATFGDSQAGALNGNDPDRRIGTSMLMKVMAGDKIEMNVNSYYESYSEEDDGPVTPDDMLSAIVSTLTGGVGGLPGEAHDTKVVTDAFTTNNYTSYRQLVQEQTDAGRPKAYLNYILFDENMRMVGSMSGAFQATGDRTWAPIGTLAPMEVPQNGYLAVYLSNATRLAGPTQNSNVYFDQLVMRVTSGRLKEEAHYYPHGLPMAGMGSTAQGYVANRHKYQANEYKTELGLNWMDFQNRQYDPQIGRFLSVDPLSDNGQEQWSPYAAMGNNPAMMVDPLGLKFDMSTEYYTRLDAPATGSGTGKKDNSPGSKDRNGEFDAFLKSTAGAAAANVEAAREENVAIDFVTLMGQVASVGESIAASIDMNLDHKLFGPMGPPEDGGSGGDPQNGGQNGSASTATGQAKVYIETDGIGHVYVEVDGTVFSYGRYNGSYSPSSGAFGPYGDGVLLKKEGTEASDFIKERTEKYPTNSYNIDINKSDAYSYLNNLYEGGKPVVNKKTGQVGPGRVIDTYTLVGPGGNNCATLVCRGLNAGGANIGIFQSPSSLNLFFSNSNAIKNGYNPGLWGPKR